MLLTSAKYERYLMRASRWDGLRAAPLGPLFGPPSGGPVLTVVALPETYVGFVDAGFLHAAGSKRIRRKKGSTRLQAKTVADWFRSLTQKQIVNGTFLRAYWYDGAFDPNHERFGDQRRFFDAIAHTPSVQLRLGHIAERRSRLERPIRNALVSTAKGIGVLPDRLTTEFDKTLDFSARQATEGSRYANCPGHGAPRGPLGFLNSGPHSRRSRLGRGSAYHAGLRRPNDCSNAQPFKPLHRTGTTSRRSDYHRRHRSREDARRTTLAIACACAPLRLALPR